MTSQRENALSVLNSLGDLDNATKEVSRTTSGIAYVSRQTQKEAEDGQQVASLLKKQVGEAGDAMNTLGDAVNALATRSLEIGNIVDSINDIASQSNLLALNATIEVARAGNSDGDLLSLQMRWEALRENDPCNIKRLGIPSGRHRKTRARRSQ